MRLVFLQDQGLACFLTNNIRMSRQICLSVATIPRPSGNWPDTHEMIRREPVTYGSKPGRNGEASCP